METRIAPKHEIVKWMIRIKRMKWLAREVISTRAIPLLSGFFLPATPLKVNSDTLIIKIAITYKARLREMPKALIHVQYLSAKIHDYEPI